MKKTHRLPPLSPPKDDTFDVSQYPTRWPDYVGQLAAVETMRDASASARIRKAMLDHTLISHPTPGIGKTGLAVLAATELRRPYRVVSGVVTLQRARMLFSTMKDRDVLIYDEMHQVGKKNAESWMLAYLQDGVLPGPRGPERQPNVTVIGTTTHVQKIPGAVVDRFKLQPPLTEYTVEEAGRIAQKSAVRIMEGLPRLTKREAMMLADAAGCNPRAIGRLLTTLRDKTITKRLPLVNGRYDINEFLRRMNITPDGLDPTAQRYLKILGLDFGGLAGASALEDQLQKPGGLIETERVLINKGYVSRTRTGRQLTQAGLARYNDLLAG